MISFLFMFMAIGLMVSSAAAQPPVFVPGSHEGIQVLSPIGGETLVLGKQYPIRWESARGEEDISLALFLNKRFVGTIIKGYPAAKNEYLWPAGRLVNGKARAGDGYTIGIRSHNGMVKGYSPNPFRLTAD